MIPPQPPSELTTGTVLGSSIMQDKERALLYKSNPSLRVRGGGVLPTGPPSGLNVEGITYDDPAHDTQDIREYISDSFE
ncbi:unnamed protein product [Vitrella brassicaformis CCMP3155]|uniref:Uncharacterized protein n=1 Tax=Vitrella brassicaformis (strain CCMP3155) TaxID=1169540 RepID=A0A0G4GZK2_VITBC|nr:unnamed protein product [Vitrella brassicaformis CCMP3155]|eukprot:CEM36647.1 unnamed protein product [Vitrella brassicaformis CCMP3155]